MSEQYGWKFILDGTTDITDMVTSFSITSSLAAYCRELSFAVTDEDLYYSFNFAIIPESPRVEVFTRILALDQTDEYGDEYDPAWISQGTFFIERPTFNIGIQSVAMGIWGRQSTAILGEPFAQKVTKLWEVDVSFFSIVEEILESVGLTWEDSRSDLQDITIYADNFEADDIYPIDVLKKLVNLIVGAEGFVTSDRLGSICIKRLVREPDTSDHDFADDIVQSISEEPEWPEFGNRIKIIPNATVSQNTIELIIERKCIGTGAPSYIEMYAQVRDGNGVPIDGAVVDWSFDPAAPENVWFKYPTQAKTASQNTGRILVSNERQKATGESSVSATFSVDELIGVWTQADTSRSHNFAPADGYIIDGKNIYLTEETFTYCDQSVVISYYSKGIVKNTLVYEPEDEYDADTDTLYGSVFVIASTSGKEASQVVYVDNSCQCPPTLNVTVDPSTISYKVTADIPNVAEVLAFLENSGEAISGTIRMTEITTNATLQWASMATSTILIELEETEAINSIPGLSQCTISASPESVVGVWRIDTTAKDAYEADKAIVDRLEVVWGPLWELQGVYPYWMERLARKLVLYEAAQVNPVKTGSDLYSALYGRTIDLLSFVATGTPLLVDYNRGGGVRNYLTAVYRSASQPDSVAKVVVSADVNTEAGLSTTVNVTVRGYETPATTGGGTTGGGTTGGGGSVTYELKGPGTFSWSRSVWYNPGLGGFVFTPEPGNIELCEFSLGRYSVVRTVNGVSTTVQTTGKAINYPAFAISMGWGPGTVYGIANPGPGGMTLTVTADYNDAGTTGTVSKSVAVSPA